MRVQMTSTIAGRPAYSMGDIVELDDRIARAWIADGLAMPVREAPAETPEDLASVGVEAAVARGRRRRG